MKKNFKKLPAVTATPVSVTLKNNGVNDFYQITGSDVTITGGYSIGIDSASMDCVINIYVAQNITIGTGGSITILGKAVTESLLEGVMLECIYNGTDWDIYRTQSADYQQVYVVKPFPFVIDIVPTILTGSSVTQQYPTIADAHTFIATEGTATADNHWTIKLPSGYVNEDVVGMAYVDYQGVSGTRLKSFTSGAAYTSANEKDSIVSNCIIDSVNVAQAKAVTFKDCFIKNYAPVSAASTGYVDMQRCTVNQGDFSNTDSSQVWQSNRFIAKTGNILLAGMTNKIKDCVINEDSNSVTLPTLLENCSIDIAAITISTATTIIGGQLNATSITVNEDLNLQNIETSATIAVATDKTLTTNAVKTGTVTLNGTAAKVEYLAAWNDGVASWSTGTAWNNGYAASLGSTAWNYGEASGLGSNTAWNYGKASGNKATAFNFGIASGSVSVSGGAHCEAKTISETVFGSYCEDVIPYDTLLWDDRDLIFHIGNGKDSSSRNSCVKIYKSGKADIDSHWNFQGSLGVAKIVRTADASTYALNETTDYQEVYINSTYSATGTQTLTIDTDMLSKNTKLIFIDGGDNASANNLTIATEGSETIDGAATATISTDSGTLTLVHNGTNWFTV